MSRRAARWMTSDEAAAHLCVSPTTLGRWMHEAARLGVAPAWVDAASAGAQRRALRWDPLRIDGWAHELHAAQRAEAQAVERARRARAARPAAPRASKPAAPRASKLRERLADLGV